ncbi:hypothetical protein FRC07_008047 [Ceratobasidium sp. 392]|nr:hypothetical protein FRC07_008047 [Ceratobasidium sp. 392]
MAVFRGHIAMISPWIEPGNFYKFVNEYPEADRMDLCLQVASGLAYLHANGVVFGDLKGQNVLVGRDGVAKLTDFGLSVLEQSKISFSTTQNPGGGSARWMAPELITDSTGRSLEADVYALGMTFIEILTDRYPFPELNDMNVLFAVPVKGIVPPRPERLKAQSLRHEKWWKLLQKCWDRDPTLRPKVSAWEALENDTDPLSETISPAVSDVPGPELPPQIIHPPHPRHTYDLESLAELETEKTISGFSEGPQDGIYHICNVKYGNKAFLPNNAVQEDVVASCVGDSEGSKRHANTSKYSITSANYGLYAACDHIPSKDGNIFTSQRMYQWMLVATGNKDNCFLIGTYEESLYWGLTDGEEGTQIILRVAAFDERNAWEVVPVNRVYDALTVLYTAVDIARRAALISIERPSPPAAYARALNARPRETRPKEPPSPQQNAAAAVDNSSKSGRNVACSDQKKIDKNGVEFSIPPNTWSYVQQDTLGSANDSTLAGSSSSRDTGSTSPQDFGSSLSLPAEKVLPGELSIAVEDFDYNADSETPVKLIPSKVPSSRLGRLFHYGSLGASLAAGTATEYVRRAAMGNGANSGSPMMSEANVARLVDKLSRMRGAALKLGQFLSIQGTFTPCPMGDFATQNLFSKDAHVLPEQIERVLRQVQNNAHYMPNAQLEQVLTAELGSDWRSKFDHFDPIPVASASIGQVHKVTVSPSILSPPSSQPIPVALKVQFPNIAASISSDLANISTLLNASALLPRGLYLDRTLKVMRGELADECDYEREASALERFGELLGQKQERFKIPKVIREVTTKRVLAMEWMEGISVAKGAKWPKRIRDQIARDILTLCLRELFEFRFMQTDPNWSNFLYNPKTDQLELIDFGASREYTKEFMDNWYMLLSAAVREDREACVEYSLKLGYLTGQENEVSSIPCAAGSE